MPREHTGSLPARSNHLCLLPDTALKVTTWEPHPCGGYYMSEAWCYGPHGRLGYWMETR